MSWRDSDPADAVTAPVRAALDAIVVRGTIAFALAVLAVLPPDLPIHDRALRIIAYHGLPALLILYLVVTLVRSARQRKKPDDADAWDRAGDLAPADVASARAMAVFVPCATLVAGVVLLMPHILEPEDRTRVILFFVPLFGLLWTASALAWFDDCRRRLENAALDSDRRFRAYWAGVGH